MQYIHAHLKALRTRGNLKQDYIAAVLGIKQSTYSRIEKGEKKLTLDQLAVFAQKFGLEAHQLLEMAKFPPNP